MGARAPDVSTQGQQSWTQSPPHQGQTGCLQPPDLLQDPGFRLLPHPFLRSSCSPAEAPLFPHPFPAPPPGGEGLGSATGSPDQGPASTLTGLPQPSLPGGGAVQAEAPCGRAGRGCGSGPSSINPLGIWFLSTTPHHPGGPSASAHGHPDAELQRWTPLKEGVGWCHSDLSTPGRG